MTLRSVVYRRKRTVKEGEKKFENLVFEYERPGAAAISELVPRNRFYAGGRQVSISQVDVSLSDIELWRFCPSCSFSRRIEGEDSANECPRCGDGMWGDSGQKATMLRLKQVMANTSDRESRIGDDSDDRESRFYNKQMLADFSPEHVGPAYRIASDELPFGFEFVRSATFREINFGEYGGAEESSIAGELLARSGFALCKHCGMVQKGNKDKQQHAYACPAEKSHPEDEGNLVECLYLYREFSSEALRILLPVISSEGVDRYLNSFIAALQLGLKLKFGGKVDHLRVMTYAEPVPESDAKRRYLMLHDSVPGGTGYLQDMMQAPGTLLEVFRLARDHMVACVCNHESPDKDGCYRCLYAYRNSYGMESTSRSTAVELLGRILDQEAQFETIESIDAIKINPVFDSELEALFISALAKPKAFAVPVKIQQQVVNGKPGYFLSVGDHYYTIEPQVNLGEAEGVVFGSKPDFLIRSANAVDTEPFLPVALFLDGFKYHKQTTAEDSAKRMALVRSGCYRVWSLTWDDVQTKYAGSAAKSRNPFNEGLQPKMQPVQKGLQEKLGIGHLFKTAVSPPMAQLLSFLADPDGGHWQGLAFVRILGWFDQQSMCGPDQADTMRQRFLERSPTAMAQHFDQMGESAYGGLDRADDLLRIDCVVPLSAIHEIQPELALCNIRLDDRAPDDEVFKPVWQAFLKAYNLLQFLPFTGVSTEKGMASGLYESIPWVSGERSDSLKVDDSGMEAFLDEVVEEIRDPLARWLEHGGERPFIGFELQGDAGEIIAEAELAWLETKTAGLLPEQAEYQELFGQQGWRVVMLDDSGAWVDQVSR